VRYFLDAVGEPGPEQRLVSIGPVTTEALQKRGLAPFIAAERHDIDGLVEALLNAVV